MKDVGVDPRLQSNYDGYYDESVARWRELGAIDKVRNIRSMCQSLAPRSVIDIGAGEGAVLQRLAGSGFGDSYAAVEISESGVDRIRRRVIPGLVDCRQFDGYSIPYPDAGFDLAILSHVIEHVEHPRVLLNEAARVARYVYVEVPLEHNRGLPADFVWDSVGHINFYTARTIRLLIQSCGHEVLAQRESHPPLEQYRYRLGAKGLAAFLLKDAALRMAPGIAQQLWTYHSSLLVRSRAAPKGGSPQAGA